MVPADKNLGTCLVDTSEYVKRAFRDHLHNRNAYRELSERTAEIQMDIVRDKLQLWLKKHHNVLTCHERKFVNESLNQPNDMAVFYQTIKIHKNPWSTRPIISCPGTPLFHLGKWIDHKLQIIANRQPSYFKDSLTLQSMPQHPHASPFCTTLLGGRGINVYQH